MILIGPLGDGSVTLETAVSDDWDSVETLRNNKFCFGECFIGISDGLARRLLIVSGRPIPSLRMDWRRAKSLDHFVRGAVFLGPLQHVFGWLFSDAIFLNVADHLPHGDLVIEHVANGIHAQWALFLGRAFRRF